PPQPYALSLHDALPIWSAPQAPATNCPAALNGCVTTPSAVVSWTAAAASTQIIVAALVQGQTYFWRVRARTVGSTLATAQHHEGGRKSTRLNSSHDQIS